MPLYLGFETAAVLLERDVKFLNHSTTSFNEHVSLLQQQAAAAGKRCYNTSNQRGSLVLVPSTVHVIENAISSKSDLPLFHLQSLRLTANNLDILIPEKYPSHSFTHVRQHKTPCNLPAGSFYKYTDIDVFVSSPELTLVQLARNLNDIEWIKIASRFCSCFTLCQSSISGIIERPALTSVQRLYSYFKRAHSLRGAVTAQKLLKYITINALSPREISLALALQLPYRFGSYAQPKPLLNQLVRFSPQAKQVGRARFACIDLVWEASKYGLEYNGEIAHQQKTDKDIARLTALREMGYHVDIITKTQLKSATAMECVAREVAHNTGKSLQHCRLLDLGERQRFIDSLLFSTCHKSGAGNLVI